MLDQNLESINQLLKVIVGLMVRRDGTDTLNLREQIKTLNNFGLQPKEIAEILGRTGTYVNKELVGIRKEKGRKNNA